VRRNPALAIGEQSVGWLYRALQGSAEARARASAATDPILLLQAGDDELVMPAAQDEFCARAPHCRLLRFPGARHEILQERDSIREPALREIFQFFKQNRRA
jgi:lysophospholipase